MALSDADLLLVYTDTLRGLEADRARASILASADEYQAARLEVLDQQIEAAQQAVEKAQAAVDVENERIAKEAREQATSAVEAVPEDSFADDYGSLTKAQLVERAGLKGVDVKASDKKDDIITQLRADDLRRRTPAA